ncbi:MAG: DUF4340 domain-containing protein [Chloroflexota bacterium]
MEVAALRQVPSSPSASASGPAAVPTATILDFGAGTVTGLDIKTMDHETSLTKNGANWQLVKPSEDPNVDQTKVNQLVGQLYALASQRSVAKPGEDITPYGLRDPRLTAVLSGGGKTETLIVGDKNVNGNQYFATRQEGSDVGLIPSALVDSLNALATGPPLARPTPSSAASASPAASPLLPSIGPAASPTA